MLKKEFMKNKVIYMTILIFIILSALLMTVGTIVIMQTSDSMQSIFEIAKPPHFLQMHLGEIGQEEIDEFAKKVNAVTAEETVEMINIDGASIWYERQSGKGEKLISMSGNMMDNGFVKQNKKFDYLLDGKNDIIQQEKGIIGVPISYQQEYDLRLGDKVIISQGEFYAEYQIGNFVRDTQMASTMASSTRFLLSDADYETLKSQVGELEYIIEFRFTDSKYASEFQKKYEAEESNMPKNGQAITYPLIKLVNALSSGLLAGMMIFVSFILILIAALVLKFTLLAGLEEEIHEIGVLKAIGISNKDIQKHYLFKYKVLAIIGCIGGYVLGLLSSHIFTKGIQVMFGGVKFGAFEIGVPVLTVFLVYLLIMHYTKKVLRQIKKTTVVQALVLGEAGTKKKKKNTQFFSLQKYCKKHINGYLGLKELFAEKRMWLLIVFSFMLASNVILNPINLIHTFQASEFASNMGNADSDIQIIIQAKQQLDEKCQMVLDEVNADKRILKACVYSIKKYEVIGKEENENIQIESGDYSAFTIDCIEGRMPQKAGEIAISYLNQKKLGKNVGEFLDVIEEGKKVNYKVCGIYQDITSGGYTAKVFSDEKKENAQLYTIQFNCKSKEKIQEIASEYDKKYEFAKALPMEDYMAQTFGSVVSSFEKAVPIMIAVAAMIVSLIMVLFLKLQRAKKQKEFVMLRILGFGQKDLLKQYLLKSVVAAGVGIVIGTIFANTLGAQLIGGLLSIVGLEIAHFRYISNPWINMLVCPIGLLGIAVLITYLFIKMIQSESEIRIMQE